MYYHKQNQNQFSHSSSSGFIPRQAFGGNGVSVAPYPRWSDSLTPIIRNIESNLSGVGISRSIESPSVNGSQDPLFTQSLHSPFNRSPHRLQSQTHRQRNTRPHSHHMAAKNVTIDVDQRDSVSPQKEISSDPSNRHFVSALQDRIEYELGTQLNMAQREITDSKIKIERDLDRKTQTATKDVRDLRDRVDSFEDLRDRMNSIAAMEHRLGEIDHIRDKMVSIDALYERFQFIEENYERYNKMFEKTELSINGLERKLGNEETKFRSMIESQIQSIEQTEDILKENVEAQIEYVQKDHASLKNNLQKTKSELRNEIQQKLTQFETTTLKTSVTQLIAEAEENLQQHLQELVDARNEDQRSFLTRLETKKGRELQQMKIETSKKVEEAKREVEKQIDVLNGNIMEEVRLTYETQLKSEIKRLHGDQSKNHSSLYKKIERVLRDNDELCLKIESVKLDLKTEMVENIEALTTTVNQRIELERKEKEILATKLSALDQKLHFLQESMLQNRSRIEEVDEKHCLMKSPESQGISPEELEKVKKELEKEHRKNLATEKAKLQQDFEIKSAEFASDRQEIQSLRDQIDDQQRDLHQQLQNNHKLEDEKKNLVQQIATERLEREEEYGQLMDQEAIRRQKLQQEKSQLTIQLDQQTENHHKQVSELKRTHDITQKQIEQKLIDERQRGEIERKQLVDHFEAEQIALRDSLVVGEKDKLQQLLQQQRSDLEFKHEQEKERHEAEMKHLDDEKAYLKLKIKEVEKEKLDTELSLKKVHDEQLKDSEKMYQEKLETQREELLGQLETNKSLQQIKEEESDRMKNLLSEQMVELERERKRREALEKRVEQLKKDRLADTEEKNIVIIDETEGLVEDTGASKEDSKPYDDPTVPVSSLNEETRQTTSATSARQTLYETVAVGFDAEDDQEEHKSSDDDFELIPRDVELKKPGTSSFEGPGSLSIDEEDLDHKLRNLPNISDGSNVVEDVQDDSEIEFASAEFSGPGGIEIGYGSTGAGEVRKDDSKKTSSSEGNEELMRKFEELEAIQTDDLLAGDSTFKSELGKSDSALNEVSSERKLGSLLREGSQDENNGDILIQDDADDNSRDSGVKEENGDLNRSFIEGLESDNQSETNRQEETGGQPYINFSEELQKEEKKDEDHTKKRKARYSNKGGSFDLLEKLAERERAEPEEDLEGGLEGTSTEAIAAEDSSIKIQDQGPSGIEEDDSSGYRHHEMRHIAYEEEEGGEGEEVEEEESMDFFLNTISYVSDGMIRYDRDPEVSEILENAQKHNFSEADILNIEFEDAEEEEEEEEEEQYDEEEQELLIAQTLQRQMLKPDDSILEREEEEEEGDEEMENRRYFATLQLMEANNQRVEEGVDYHSSGGSGGGRRGPLGMLRNLRDMHQLDDEEYSGEEEGEGEQEEYPGQGTHYQYRFD